MQKSMARKIINGFTVVELLIVIVAIGVVAGVVIVGYNGVSSRSANAQLMSDLTAAADQLEIDYADNKAYPELASQANGNKGLATSPGTELTYVANGSKQWYCVEASSDKPGTKTYHAERDGRVTEGPCPEAPQDEVAVVDPPTDPTPPPPDPDPTPPPADTDVITPATPVVNASTSGSNTTWSWGAASCNIGSPNYEYNYGTSGVAGSWADTTSTSLAFNTSTQGYTYSVSVRARCENGAQISAWSGIGSKTYSRPVTNDVQIGNGAAHVWVPDKAANAIHGKATTTGLTGSCSSGTRAIARYRTQLNQASWVDRGSWVVYGSGWTVYYNTDLDNGDLLEFSYFAMCQNPTTGVTGSQAYADLYGNLNITQNRNKPTRGQWNRGCDVGHSSTIAAGPFCVTDSGTFAAFP